jgi:hypothetical protein
MFEGGGVGVGLAVNQLCYPGEERVPADPDRQPTRASVS